MINLKIYKHIFNAKGALQLLGELYQDKNPEELKKAIYSLKKQKDFHLLIAYQQNEAVAITCLNSGYLIYCGKYLQLSSLYIKPKFRNLGIVQSLFKKAEQIALKTKCSKIALDSYITNNNSHKTYFRENFSINAYHFIKEL